MTTTAQIMPVMSDADLLWQLLAIAAVLGNLVQIYLRIKGGQSMRIAEQPVQVQAATRHVTHDEFGQLILRIDRMEQESSRHKAQTDANLREIFVELRTISRSIGRIEGKQLSSD